VPLNASRPESKSQKPAFSGFNDVAFGRVNDQFQAVLQEVADAMEHPLTGTPTFYQDRKIIGVSSEAMPAFLQLFVQRIEHDVREQGR
jgi:hypothetical protein